MIVSDGTSVAAAMNGTIATPAFLADDKLNKRSKRMVNVVDLYETIAEISNEAADNLAELFLEKFKPPKILAEKQLKFWEV